jgi:hypothetical protein
MDPSAIHHFDAKTWGTVWQTFGAIGTTSAFWAGVYVIRRDANLRRREQARKIAFHSPRTPDGGFLEGVGSTAVKNLSDEPISELHFVVFRDTGESIATRYHGDLLPGEIAYFSNTEHAPYTNVGG